MTVPIIEIKDLTFSYDGANALEDVNLTIDKNDFVCLVGPNGGGKTTLLRLILGLLAPTRGRVTVFGGRPKQARQRLGYMPQHAQVDPRFPATVADVVLMGRLGRAEIFGPYRAPQRAAAWRALDVVGLSDFRTRPFGSLSGGQRQRALIARALATEPELLLLDEPTANLDAHAEHELYELMRRLNEKLTIVMVSHDLGFVSEFVKSVACVKRHVVVHPTSEITGEIIQEMYGGVVRMVRHDLPDLPAGHGCDPGDATCQSS
jgi:zinc transport system ATP-binding protein